MNIIFLLFKLNLLMSFKSKIRFNQDILKTLTLGTNKETLKNFTIKFKNQSPTINFYKSNENKSTQ